jgi:hypothetical protein
MNLRLVSVVLAVFAIFVGCNRGGQSLSSRIRPPARVQLPSQILGLTVTQENVDERLSPIKKSTYLDSFGLFSMRQKDLLQASLQVGRFNTTARQLNQGFERQIVGLMGTSNPREILVGKKTVFTTATNRQTIFVWFAGRGFYVLTARNDYPFEFTLLRKLISMEQKF